MKNLTLFFLGLLSSAMAQMAPQPLPQVEHLQGQNYLFSWEGVPGRMYFIQTSSSLAANEFDWQFAPDIRVGTGSQIEMGFQANAAHFEFFRLVYNDLSEGEDANLKDNDGDGFTNLEEAIANTDPNNAQSYPGSSGNTGGGNSGGSSGSGTTWNHPWEYKLTHKVEGSIIGEDFINPYNEVGSYEYDLEVGYETKIIFENIEGDNMVTFLQLERDLSSSSSSNAWKSKGVVELSKQNLNWINDDDPQGTGAVGLFLPVEIIVAFGQGPDIPDGQGDKNSRELLEEYLDGIKVARQGDIWAVNGKDAQGNDKIWGVEIVSDQAKLNAGLSSGDRYVVFDGHSNFGLGPDFGGISITKIADLTNYGVKYTDVPLNFRLRGPVNDPTKWGDPFIAIQVGDNEIPAAPTNDKPLPINEERFPNIDGVGVGKAFQKQGQGFDTWHYRIQGGSKRLMIDAPKTDLPANLAYKTFFYNACNTGIDYIENFKRGDFIYTNDSCFVLQGTRIYVQGVVEGKTTGQIMPLLNQLGVGGNDPNDTIYEFKSF